MIENDAKYDEEKLANLLDAMQEDELSVDQEKELQTILKSNKNARRSYLENVSMEDSLYWNNAESAVLPFPEDEKVTVNPVNVGLKTVLIVAAMLILTATIIITSIGDFGSDSNVELATIHEGPNVILKREGSGDRLEAGKYNLVSGIVEIVFDSGARMKVFSPSEFEVLEYNHARLNKGEVRISVPDDALGFRLETEAANFVDIGTEFSVKVSDSQIAELHVLEGVVVARPNRGQTVVSFGKNESGRIEPVFGEVTQIDSQFKSMDQLAPNQAEVKFKKIQKSSKVIFLGDRNTDFETYLHMVNQAIYDAEPENAPTLLNAGMTLRLFNTDPEFKELVLDLDPTHAVLAFGPEIAANDGNKAIYQIAPEEFEQKIRRIVKLLVKNDIVPVIMTGFYMNTKNPACVKLLDTYNRILRQIAAEGNYRLAEADKIYEIYKAGNNADKLVDNDQKYCTFEGYRVMARSVLNSFGYSGLAVPDKLRFKTLPGLIREWYATDAILKSDMLSEEKIAALEYKKWDKIFLPQPAYDQISQRLLIPHQTYPIQARSLGVAMGITSDWRNKTRAVAEIHSENEVQKYINLGEDIKSVWINGKQINKKFMGIYVDGRHPGFYRLPINFKKGTNVIVIEAYNSFFASITDKIDWGLPKPPVK